MLGVGFGLTKISVNNNPFFNGFSPDILLLDLSGNAIEDANNPGEYWVITFKENEDIQ